MVVGKVVSKKGSMVQVWDILYKEVVKSVSIYGSKSWVVMGAVLKVQEGFHCPVARRIMGMTTQCKTDR